MKLIWKQEIGLDDSPYLVRWVVDFGPFAIRLHHWFASDDVRALHDHAWWFLTLVLWGSYTDVSSKGNDQLKTGSIRFRHSDHAHTVHITHKGTWTLLITGKPTRRWGFWVNGKLIKRDKYFAVYGHHTINNDDAVRIRPDGTKI